MNIIIKHIIESIDIDIKNLNYKCNKKLMVVKECVCACD